MENIANDQIASFTRTFPELQSHYSFLKSFQQVQARLNHQSMILKVFNPFTVCHNISNEFSFRCNNNKCSAHLIYNLTIKKTTLVKLTSFSNIHNHEIYQNIRKLVQEQMKKIGTSCNRNSVIKMLKYKYQIKTSYLQNIYSSIFNKPIDFTNYLEQLINQGYKVFQQFFDDDSNYNTPYPKYVIAVSQSMIQKFKDYGQFIGFDLTYNLIKDKLVITDLQSQRNWGVGFFTGISATKKLLPFGCVLTCDEKSETFYKIFQTFFSFVGSQPNLIITDQQIAIACALKKMQSDGKYKGYHTLDIFHKLRSLRGKLQISQNLQIFRQLMKIRNDDEFELKAKQFYKTIKSDNDYLLLEDFIRNADNYCFSFLPKMLIGFNSSNSPSQKINDMVKTQIPYQMSLPRVFKIIMKYLNKLCNRSSLYEIQNRPIQDIFQYKSLFVLKNFIAKPIFAIVIQQYVKCLKSSSIINDNQAIVISSLDISYFLRKQQQKWICNCYYEIRAGLPCSHQLRILEQQGQDLLKYVHSRWILNSDHQQNPQHALKSKSLVPGQKRSYKISNTSHKRGRRKIMNFQQAQQSSQLIFNQD